VSNWAYVAIAYTVVWGSLAVYAVLLARRVVQARDVARRMSEVAGADTEAAQADKTVCDGAPAP